MARSRRRLTPNPLRQCTRNILSIRMIDKFTSSLKTGSVRDIQVDELVNHGRSTIWFISSMTKDTP